MSNLDRKTLVEAAEGRFWAKVQKSPDCWIWRGGTDRHGYGQMSIGPRNSPWKHSAAHI